MDKKALALLLICLIALLGSFIYGFVSPVETFLGNYSIIILVLIFFFFGIIAFGFLSYIPHFLLGLGLGTQKNAIIFLYLIPIIMATYSGLKLGAILFDDFNRKKYFLKEGKNIITLIILAIIIAIAIEQLLPLIMEINIWPQDTLGMKLERPESVNEALEIMRNGLLGR